MSDQQCRTRKCYVCYGKVSSRATNDNRRHNCVSLGEALCGEIPDECWQLQQHPYVLDILLTITACQQKGKHSEIAHQRRVELAKMVLSATETGQLDKKTFFEGAAGFSSRQLKGFLDALPESSSLRDLLAQPVAEITKPKLQEKAPKPKKAIVELPPEFEKALGVYAEASERRAKLKVERGHEYDPRTAIRRIEDARRLCEFLVQHGVTRWADVAARHLGARQDSCRLNHAASACKVSPSNDVFMTESRSGLSVTAPTCLQLRVFPDQRAGFCSLARRYNA